MTVAEKLRRATDEELARLLFQYHQIWKMFDTVWTEAAILKFLQETYLEKPQVVQSTEEGVRADTEDSQ